MRNVVVVIIAAWLAACGSGGDERFAADEVHARENAASAAGSAYVKRFDAAIFETEVMNSLTKCLAGGGKDSVRVHGFVRFRDDGTHVAELRPRGVEASCVADVLANATVPAPPSVPYLVEFAAGGEFGKR
ncbi:MAG TPA: hypothetical protein VFB32_10760 [Rudaea sp.]|nr:hypothetical protein [Rudaea sp.]